MVLPELSSFYEDLDRDKLRIERPSKLIFLCGGAISSKSSRKPISLRDYVQRVKKIEDKLSGRVVLAEKATQLYGSTFYTDLITFEEDIARIAAAIVVIVESPGAFAELGAFATSQTISRNLLLVIKQEHSETESFITLGPVKRIKSIKRSLVGEFPWRTDKDGNVIVASASPHVATMISFVNDYVESKNKTDFIINMQDSFNFYLIYWIIYIAQVTCFDMLLNYIRCLIPNFDEKELTNKLYCMVLSSWIKKVPYFGKDYFFVLHDKDPFHYAFKADAPNKDSLRRKYVIQSAMKRLENIPSSIKDDAIAARKGA